MILAVIFNPFNFYAPLHKATPSHQVLSSWREREAKKKTPSPFPFHSQSMEEAKATTVPPIPTSRGILEKGGFNEPGTLAYALCRFSTSGVAVGVATTITHPMDVLKVRLQMQLAGQRGQLVGMGQIFTQMIKAEGPGSLYLGIVPALARSLLYGGLRLGLYEPCKHACEYAFGSSNFALKFGSGAVSGALATALTNPTEVLKVRLQMNPTTGPVKELRNIITEEGIGALWKGVGPAMVRAGCLTASQVATYDESKQALLRWTPLREGVGLHLISSCIAGTTGTLMTAPVDMIKTRLMLQSESRGAKMYRNGFHCAYQVVVSEGLGALYKGGFATFARIGPQTTITFLVYEQLRKLAGINAL